MHAHSLLSAPHSPFQDPFVRFQLRVSRALCPSQLEWTPKQIEEMMCVLKYCIMLAACWNHTTTTSIFLVLSYCLDPSPFAMPPNGVVAPNGIVPPQEG